MNNFKKLVITLTLSILVMVTCVLGAFAGIGISRLFDIKSPGDTIIGGFLAISAVIIADRIARPLAKRIWRGE